MKSRKTTPAETQGNPRTANNTKQAGVTKLSGSAPTNHRAIFHRNAANIDEVSSQYSDAGGSGNNARNHTTNNIPRK